MSLNIKQKVAIAMSGGVDSAVAADLLKEEGFEVQGVFLKLADLPQFRQGERSAKKTAKALGIPFLTFDFRKEFRKKVIKYFLVEVEKGRTPNPCVVCNKEIKLGFLLRKVLSLGFDFLATGHYVRKQEVKNKKQKTRYKLLVAKDKEKDQSYFLWQLTQNQLRHILFPVGDYTKTEVKKLAKKFKILKLVRPESNDICFVQTTPNDFLKKNIKSKPGRITNPKGKVIGQHQGLCFYTIGQRKGIKIGGAPKPFYVLNKNLKKNILIVTQNKEDLNKKELICEKVSWVLEKKPKLPLKARAKVRYRHEAAQAIIKPYNQGALKIIFSQSQQAITPGQSVVFYQRQQLLGGGIIK